MHSFCKNNKILFFITSKFSLPFKNGVKLGLIECYMTLCDWLTPTIATSSPLGICLHARMPAFLNHLASLFCGHVLYFYDIYDF